MIIILYLNFIIVLRSSFLFLFSIAEDEDTRDILERYLGIRGKPYYSGSN